MPVTSARDPRVDEIVSELPTASRPIARALCRLVRVAAPELRETVKWNQPSWTGHGNVVGLMLYPNQVHLAVFRGAELAERFPEIVGTGKSLRHVVVPDVRSARRPRLRAIIRAAVALDASEGTTYVAGSPRGERSSARTA
jgi:hypothetical protein